MANLKDLIVRGVSRFIGETYVSNMLVTGIVVLVIENGTVRTQFWNYNDPNMMQSIGLGVDDPSTPSSNVGGTVEVSPNGVFINSRGRSGTVIRNVSPPLQDTDAVNKKYVDDAIAAIPLYDGTVIG